MSGTALAKEENRGIAMPNWVHKAASGMVPRIKQQDILYQGFREAGTASAIGENIRIRNNGSGKISVGIVVGPYMEKITF